MPLHCAEPGPCTRSHRDAWLALLCALSAKCLHLQALANSGWAVAKMGVAPSPRWANAWLTMVGYQMGQLKPQVGARKDVGLGRIAVSCYCLPRAARHSVDGDAGHCKVLARF
jgi:hypothetical protein